MIALCVALSPVAHGYDHIVVDTIKYVQVKNDQAGVNSFELTTTPGNCTDPQFVPVAGVTDGARKATLSILLTAFVGGKEVRVAYNVDGNDCRWENVRILD